jgi:hypothetical protein
MRMIFRAMRSGADVWGCRRACPLLPLQNRRHKHAMRGPGSGSSTSGKSVGLSAVSHWRMVSPRGAQERIRQCEYQLIPYVHALDRVLVRSYGHGRIDVEFYI